MKIKTGWLGSVAFCMALGCNGERAGPSASATRELREAVDGAATEGGGSETVSRGRYLVSHVAACVDCHSPRRADKSFDPSLWLSGVDCFIDVAPNDPEAGCLNTRNLTHHEAGLSNRTDQEIKDMFLEGLRPDGKALHPFMPYAYYGNMSDADADAIVAYLRTVPGVDHMVTSSQPPFLPPPQPAARVPVERIPMPRSDYAEPEAALRGRYLAGNIGACLDCHTPRIEGKGLALDRAFQGGLKFDRQALGLPPTYPEVVYSSNLTPHAEGILEYSVADVVRALKYGEDKNQNGEPLCPPMPAGQMQAFGGLTDEDASDIGHYLLSLPPGDNRIPLDCSTTRPELNVAASGAGRPS